MIERSRIYPGLSSRYIVEREFGRRRGVWLAQIYRYDHMVAAQGAPLRPGGLAGGQRFLAVVAGPRGLVHVVPCSTANPFQRHSQTDPVVADPWIDGDHCANHLGREGRSHHRSRADRSQSRASFSIAHNSVIHRDIKPENVLLTRTAAPWWQTSALARPAAPAPASHRRRRRDRAHQVYVARNRPWVTKWTPARMSTPSAGLQDADNDPFGGTAIPRADRRRLTGAAAQHQSQRSPASDGVRRHWQVTESPRRRTSSPDHSSRSSRA